MAGSQRPPEHLGAFRDVQPLRGLDAAPQLGVGELAVILDPRVVRRVQPDDHAQPNSLPSMKYKATKPSSTMKLRSTTGLSRRPIFDPM